MAPEPRRKPRENQYLFELGVRGRKTGLTLPDTGIRDENGLEPMDHLFSSPEKAPKTRSTRKLNGVNKNANANATLFSEDMDVGESTVPEPTAVLTERKRASMRLPPRSKSPIKTHLRSPARRNPSLGPVSSPIRGSIVEPRAASVSASVRRKLNFSNGSLEVDEDSVVTNSSPQNRGASNPRLALAKLTNGTRLTPLKRPLFPENTGDDEDSTDRVQEDTGVADLKDSYQLVDGGDDVDEAATVDEPEEELEPEPRPAKKGRISSKVPGVVSEAAVEPVAKKNRGGRPKKANHPIEEEQEEQEQGERPTKRARNSLEVPKPIESKSNKSKKNPAAIPPKVKGPGRRSKLAVISETDSPQVQRGPPMPRRPGLMTLRRETPMDAAFKQTRSGRNSIKPIAFWRNERAEYSDDEIEDKVGKFMMSRIKGVVRVDEELETKRVKKGSKPSKSKKRAIESEDEEDAEPWEAEPGRIYGDVLTWDPEDPIGAQAEDVEEELALSSAAIITRDIAGATFRFAKTLTLPFFGSGMVDLPPGAMKKPKNSRKMQMAFFVFYGRVKVTVNGNEFRISKGGMWQVPRGNIYSIENDYERPARIFFSQGCEILEDVDESQ